MTYPPRRILVPVDFGPASARAARIAAAIADRTGAHLVALHAEAIEAPPYFTTAQIDRLERERAGARAAAHRYVIDFLRDAGGQFEVDIRDAPAGDTILLASRNADLVVMGTHGRRGPRRWWLGSVAEQVVLGSHLPVLVVRDAPADAAGTLFSRVLVHEPAPAGPSMTAARRYAAGLAAAFDGSVLEISGDDAARAAREKGGTLLVVPRGVTPDDAWFEVVGEHLLRECGIPMLFVTG